MESTKSRTKKFRWHSRHELYSYFQTNFGLPRHEIDEQIDRVMESFRPRKGQAIITSELWQKVGLSLETALGAHRDNEIDDVVVYEIKKMRNGYGSGAQDQQLPPQPDVRR